MRNAIQEIEAVLRPLGNEKRKKIDEWYEKSSFEHLGIPVPIQRAVSKRGFSFSHLPHEEQRRIWDHVWKHSNVKEAMRQALFYFARHKKHLTPADWRILKTWVERIDSWPHSDYLSDLYSHLLERHPKLIYPTLKAWNKSGNPWKRRTSVVSLIYYMTPKRKAPAVGKILPLVKNLLHDADDYVRKGVGWTLRECGHIYPEETWRFLKEHAQDLSAVSFSYATERLPKSKKAELKLLRTANRLKKKRL